MLGWVLGLFGIGNSVVVGWGFCYSGCWLVGVKVGYRWFFMVWALGYVVWWLDGMCLFLCVCCKVVGLGSFVCFRSCGGVGLFFGMLRVGLGVGLVVGWCCLCLGFWWKVVFWLIVVFVY